MENDLARVLEDEEGAQLISVCMATYNGAAYLREQLDSILVQLEETDELIVSDDGSTDETVAILASYAAKDPRIQVLKGPGKGLIKNFEYGIRHTRGELVFLADQDDVWLPEKVAKIKAVFAENPAVDVVVSDLSVTDEQLKVQYASYFQLKKVKTGFWRNVWRNGYIGAGMAFRSRLKEKILPFPDKIPMHDMWIGLLAGNKLRLLPESLTLYRRHGNNSSELASSTSFRQKLVWRGNLLMSLRSRIRTRR